MLEETFNSDVCSLTDFLVNTIEYHVPFPMEQVTKVRRFAKRLYGVSYPSPELLLATVTFVNRLFEQKEAPKKLFPDGVPEEAPLLVLLVAYVVAYKYWTDKADIMNHDWSREAGVCSLAILNTLERRMLRILGYDLVVEDAATQASWQLILDHMKQNGGRSSEVTLVPRSDSSCSGSTASSRSSVWKPRLGEWIKSFLRKVKS
ncbi:hypothetical protein BCR33DRAFT_716507 [Rhizoclosmatium globosum]|uniref:Cyclin N-terminal domain-containing protein n=1 Tax=Rhizoclosmatium globosum TaxID=329046 RepID=A0A1Y2CDQ4_9FUNG|nr:hypothetical protein BCR33DRAFT_716507 [Rhizoclosmatium globosum]|eukprot:ORY45188.1 hypothetical protein BCR33DRAFT_716507 [Rhizoclosmatium globosum]